MESVFRNTFGLLDLDLWEAVLVGFVLIQITGRRDHQQRTPTGGVQ